MSKKTKQQQISTAFHLNGLVFLDISTPKYPNACMICDEEDYTKWKLSPKYGRIYPSKSKTGTYPYAYFRYNNRPNSFHRFVLQTKQNVDHINRNGFDNTRSNLREASHMVNGWNRPKQANNTTGYKGVYYRADRNRFCAYIQVNNEKRILGRFKTAEEAHERYKQAEARRWAGLPLSEL